ncbi:CCCH zinc finger protein [Talaromyces islandicus]|uniref:CCCH zinc finger protein n=1 Tax=Talaromyces islandicus TaxID=28573 RepID=A0A0U1MA09_TALIS|nr:CCCH zinc finger protein [Talaromyces islandicus]
MASQGFSFPPPPPPPPPQQQQQQQAPGYANAAPSYGNYNGYPQRGGYRGGNFNRGRGRGGMSRGGRGGGGYNNYRGQQGGSGGGAGGVGGGGYNGYSPASSVPVQSLVTAPNYYAGAASHPPSQPPSSAAQAYSRTPASTYPPTNYDGRHRADSAAQAMGHGNNMPATQGQPGGAPARGLPGSAHAMVAPPMHWGYDSNTGASGFYPGSTNGLGYSAQQSYQGHGHGNVQGGTGYKNHGHKRTYSSSFGKSTSNVPRAPAPPAVPSFGVPLPAKPPQATDASKKIAKKKKRKFNQLGLTPNTEEHESSAEEDDVDEEARFTANPGGPLEFTFRGRTSTLNSAADIQKWIEERKKRFPTQARVEEKKKAQEEARKQKDLQREEARRKQQEAKQRTKPGSKEPGEQEIDPMDAAVKAKVRAERLRKKLYKEEKRLQKAEADAERARLMAEASQRGQEVDVEATEEDTKEVVVEADDSMEKDPTSIEPPASSPMQGDDQDEPLLSDDTDSSEDDNRDDAPEEVSSRRDGPERVPPPPRGTDAKRKKPCHNFQRRGRCPRGDRCRYSHDILGPGDKTRSDAATTKRPVRRGLFQMLVNQEMEARDGQVMQAISWLGSQGFLESCSSIAESAST